MCVIIERQPNFEIPYDDFESATHVNPDGYGIAIPDGNGKLSVIRSHKKPDPQELYSLINNELIDTKLLIHLRYTTVGKTDMRNAHPFPVLEYKIHGVDIRMAHNGTIGAFKPSGTDTSSDTRHFVKNYVRPLFQRLIKSMTSEEILSDPFVEWLLSDQIPKSSVLSFMDGYGNTMTIHEEGNGGKREEGWYYSNKYSFNRKHREPAPRSNVYYPPTYHYGMSPYHSTGNTEKVFIWDNIADDKLLEVAVPGVKYKTLHNMATSKDYFLPFYNLGPDTYDYSAYMITEEQEQLIDLPEEARGMYMPVRGKLIELDKFDLFDLDLFYTADNEFETKVIEVRANPNSNTLIKATTWITDPSSITDGLPQLNGFPLRKGLELTPFDTMKTLDVYKY